MSFIRRLDILYLTKLQSHFKYSFGKLHKKNRLDLIKYDGVLQNLNSHFYI